MSILSLSDLNFGYKKNEPILKGLNLAVPKGSIYGFLGSNGAGKSTTIRNILGLLKPQSGRISIFGKTLNTNQRNLFHQIGSLIESPSLYPHLCANDNLKIASKYLGVSNLEIEKVLEKVGLIPHRKKAVKKYSTGMKQRLGLAMALVHNPELLILDEPTNGLDPTGITEIRKIIMQLNAEGKTILLSSHLLSEIEKMATHVGIIKSGEMIFEGSLSELDQLKSSQQTLEIKTTNVNKTKSVLAHYSMVESEDGSLQVDVGNKENIPSLIKTLVHAEIDLYEVKLIKSDLEKMFISLTNEG